MDRYTVDRLIKELTEISEAGFGFAFVRIEEEGLGYAGDLIDVNTVLTEGDVTTLTLLGESQHPGIATWQTREQIEDWAGSPLTNEQIARIDEAIPFSSIPDAIAEIAGSLDA